MRTKVHQTITDKIHKDAFFYKKECIDYFLTKSHLELIAHEVPYGMSGRYSDLVIIESGRTISIEIKSDVDNLSRLGGQIEDSRKVFDFVIVMVSEKYLEDVIKLIPEDVGIMYYSDKLRIKRKPKRQSINIIEIAYSIPAIYIRKKRNLSSNLDVDAVRQFLGNLPKRTTRQLYLSYLKYKYLNRYQLFLNDRGECTHEDDISVLSFGEVII